MRKDCWSMDEPGKRCVLSGNEAAARGALEAGVRMVASYPGSPSVQILECLTAIAADRQIYAEWSINEKVAVEVAAAGSFAGLRSMAVMKADGLNVALDFLTTLSLSGVRGGMVIVVSDDPGAHSSVKEEDSRYLALPAHTPLMEPSSPEETRDMVRAAFEISEKTGLPVMIRLVTRICHAKATLKLRRIKPTKGKADLPPQTRFVTAGRFHQQTHDRLALAEEVFESSPFNDTVGPEQPELWIFLTGVSHYYALEAIERLGLEEKVGVFKVGTLWPLPEKKVVDVLKQAKKVLFLEEVEPFLEDQIKILAAQHWQEIGAFSFMGKRSGDVPWVMKSRGMGEMDPDIATRAVAGALGIEFEPRTIQVKERGAPFPELVLPPRLPSLCAGCPHRASFWAIKSALALDGRNGFALGDIGCYALGVQPTGFQTLASVHAMGSGIGLASGFGKLKEMGFEQPAVAVIGDSTFYHAGIPALINAKNSGAGYLCIILDNETTAMTGHQPHPGSGVTALGEKAQAVSIESLGRALDIPLTIRDPYRIEETTETILHLLQDGGLQVLLLRRACALIAGKDGQKQHVYVDQEKCLGDACGCSRLCSRVFSCPANIWDEKSGKARIDEVLCTGCGVCAALCPEGAIIVDPC